MIFRFFAGDQRATLIRRSGLTELDKIVRAPYKRHAPRGAPHLHHLSHNVYYVYYFQPRGALKVSGYKDT